MKALVGGVDCHEEVSLDRDFHGDRTLRPPWHELDGLVAVNKEPGRFQVCCHHHDGPVVSLHQLQIRGCDVLSVVLVMGPDNVGSVRQQFSKVQDVGLRKVQDLLHGQIAERDVFAGLNNLDTQISAWNMVPMGHGAGLCSNHVAPGLGVGQLLQAHLGLWVDVWHRHGGNARVHGVVEVHALVQVLADLLVLVLHGRDVGGEGGDPELVHPERVRESLKPLPAHCVVVLVSVLPVQAAAVPQAHVDGRGRVRPQA
mmetsp:Transcript_75914/g.183548  ORF Transcript_75914/g.183548 Transcript_75914/m.183548 type:complete len:256 (-) Transcript_75914:100-867(-)